MTHSGLYLNGNSDKEPLLLNFKYFLVSTLYQFKDNNFW